MTKGMDLENREPVMATPTGGRARRRFRLDLPHPTELPIPRNTVIDEMWTPIMRQIAEYIGAYATLRLIDSFGGDPIAFRIDMRPYTELVESIGLPAAQRLAFAFAGERLDLPVGKAALMRARRAPIIAAVRSGELSVSDAARLLRYRRSFIYDLLEKDPVIDPVTFGPFVFPKARASQLVEDACAVARESLAEHGIAPEIAARVCAQIEDLI